MWILVIEDERDLATSLKRGLEEEGHAVDVAFHGQDREDLGLVHDYDLLVVDWRLPGKDGKAIIETLRAEGREYPILMLTAMAGVDHKVAGLDAGADDYLAKPFSFEELLARIRSLGRRASRVVREDWLTAGSIQMDTARRVVRASGEILNLRPKEFSLLEVLLREQDRVFSRSVISERVWGSAFYVTDHVLDVTVSSLRKKLQDTGVAPSCIETVRGVGYRFNNVIPDSIRDLDVDTPGGK